MKTYLSILALGVCSALVLGCDGKIGGEEDVVIDVLGEDLPGVIPGEYIVVLKDRTSPGLVTDIIGKVSLAPGNRVDTIYSSMPAFAGALSETTLEEIRRNSDVKFIEANRTIELTQEHDAVFPGTSFVFDLSRTDQRQGKDEIYNDQGFDGDGVHVYVVDSGIRTTHTDFRGRISNGFTVINDGTGVEDCNGHGTHVASTVAGTIAGMAKNAIIHPVRVFECGTSTSLAAIVAGIDFTAEDCPKQDGPCVANLSLGGGVSAAIDNASNNAINAGVVLVAAAGNENQNACNVSPARVDGVITVAAADDNDRRAVFSNFGSCVDLFGPGVSVGGAGIDSDDSFVLIDGTSQATPHVAGAVALFLQQNPDATPAQVKDAIESVATTGEISDLRGSPNLMIFNDFSSVDNGGDEPDPNSCEDRCGIFDAAQFCQCDAQCVNFGDCCDDVAQVCSQ